jgi:hypothetical protein
MMPASRCWQCSKVRESTAAIAGYVSVQGLLLTFAMHAALAVDDDGAVYRSHRIWLATPGPSSHLLLIPSAGQSVTNTLRGHSSRVRTTTFASRPGSS